MTAMGSRVAVVTGASSGIGLAAATSIAAAGGAVALLARPGDDLAPAEAECRRHNVNALSLSADVGNPDSVTEAFDLAAAELGPVDAVFNNAGISLVAPITETTDDQWQRLLHTNLTGSFNVARAAARTMSGRPHAAIVNTASELALTGEAGYAAYTATKGAILAMTRALAAELAADGIRVNAICPGPVDTPLFRAEFTHHDDPSAIIRETEASIPLGRIGQTEEVAAVVVFLLSESARFITGSHYVVDGGRTGCFPSQNQAAALRSAT